MLRGVKSLDEKKIVFVAEHEKKFTTYDMEKTVMSESKLCNIFKLCCIITELLQLHYQHLTANLCFLITL